MPTARSHASRTPVEEVEVDLLLEAIYRIRGFDFRDYARTSLRRRIQNRLRAEKIDTITRLVDRVVHDAACMDRLVGGLSVNVSTMFRDPAFFRALQEQVFPLLRTWPAIRIWQAGCSMGEEVYSLAIVLAENGLIDRCRIYATDINEIALQRALAGIYPLELMQRCEQLRHLGCPFGAFIGCTLRQTAPVLIAVHAQRLCLPIIEPGSRLMGQSIRRPAVVMAENGGNRKR